MNGTKIMENKRKLWLAMAKGLQDTMNEAEANLLGRQIVDMLNRADTLCLSTKIGAVVMVLKTLDDLMVAQSEGMIAEGDLAGAVCLMVTFGFKKGEPKPTPGQKLDA